MVFYKRDHPGIIRNVFTGPWVRPDAGNDRIGDVGVYLRSLAAADRRAPTGPRPDVRDRQPGQGQPRARLRQEAGRVPGRRRQGIRDRRPLRPPRDGPDARARRVRRASPDRGRHLHDARSCRAWRSRSAKPSEAEIMATGDRSCDSGSRTTAGSSRPRSSPRPSSTSPGSTSARTEGWSSWHRQAKRHVDRDEPWRDRLDRLSSTTIRGSSRRSSPRPGSGSTTGPTGSATSASILVPTGSVRDARPRART